MKLGKDLVSAIFVKRMNRFLVAVERDGEEFEAFLANSGRLREILVSGRRLLLRSACDRFMSGRSAHGKRRTGFDVLGAFLEESFVTIDSRLPGALVKEALLAGSLPEFRGYHLIRGEPAFGRGRFDFLLEPSCFLEVKGCTLVRHRVALFPDAPTLRGRRHLEELAQGRKAGYRACVIFVVQREDAEVFRPNWETDPGFGQALTGAMDAGVEAFAYASCCQAGELKIARRMIVQLSIDEPPICESFTRL